MSYQVTQIIPWNKVFRSLLSQERIRSPLSCAQYLATYRCPKTVECSPCLPNLHCFKICCHAFLPFMLSPWWLCNFRFSDVCMHFTSVHAFFIAFPSHPLYLFCIHSCVKVLTFLLPDLSRCWHVYSVICVLMLQILLNWFWVNILVLEGLPDDPKRFVKAVRSAGQSGSSRCFNGKYRVAQSRADWHISHLNIALTWWLVEVGRRGNGRRQDATSYGQEQWSVGTCNSVLPVLIVSATSLDLLGRPTLSYQIFSCGDSWKTVCSGGVSWLFQNSNQQLWTKLRLLMRTYGGACTATSRHACNNAMQRRPSAWCNLQKISL
jgi:hypothetical protein